ncbi:NAD(P)-binding protein [Melanomma pulvis-pyrius CBS 109.77]|uniref:NAD(P)-binding protein n=1 Tax=Melanomma pulvis-pyrius CBS 109.77 TaxID=1314802 RepID=A0A6A6XVQ7_9PLEO|nr:NAD(P)-binding protein [Melanomma pulvis-pyrius CBS 109.77]
MSEIRVEYDLLPKGSEGRVVVIAGGANGIGEALVNLFYRSGAHVYFSDWDTVKGTKLEGELKSSSSSGHGSVRFSQADARDYAAQLAVFDAAYKEHGIVDHAVFTVGISDPPGWMSGNSLNLETVKKLPVPLDDVLDINLKGCLYFSRIAIAYMKEGFVPNIDSTGAGTRKSLTLLSSANGFHSAPGLYAYAASKSGIIGMLRSFSPISVQNLGIRVNVVCPTATDTKMVANARDFLIAMNAPLSTAEGCGKIIQQLVLDPRHHGKVVLVMSDRGWDIEEGLNRTRHQWMDDEAATILEETQVKMGPNTDWAAIHT